MRLANTSVRALAGLLLLALGGCGLKQTLGWEKAPPDEFSIATNQPLVIPPSYDLRPPAPGTNKTPEGPGHPAEEALFGSVPAVPPGTSQSPGELALLQHAGADRADPQIRQRVNSETAPVSDRGQGFTDRVLYGTGQANPPAANSQTGGQPAPAPSNKPAGAS